MTGIKLAAGVFSALVVLTACSDGGDGDGGDDSGFADESAADIQEAATEDMQALESAHLTGTLAQAEAEVSLDLSLNTDGDCEGTVSQGEAGEAEVIQLDGTSWFRPDEAFWRAQAGPQADQILSVVGDNWVLLPEGDESFASFCDLGELLDQIGESEGTSEKDGTEDIDGAEAVRLTREEEGATTTAWVAVDDPHHILQVERTGGDQPGTFSFSEFDEELGIEPPADDEVVDLTELQG